MEGFYRLLDADWGFMFFPPFKRFGVWMHVKDRFGASPPAQAKVWRYWLKYEELIHRLFRFLGYKRHSWRYGY